MELSDTLSLNLLNTDQIKHEEYASTGNSSINSISVNGYTATGDASHNSYNDPHNLSQRNTKETEPKLDLLTTSKKKKKRKKTKTPLDATNSQQTPLNEPVSNLATKTYRIAQEISSELTDKLKEHEHCISNISQEPNTTIEGDFILQIKSDSCTYQISEIQKKIFALFRQKEKPDIILENFYMYEQELALEINKIEKIYGKSSHELKTSKEILAFLKYAEYYHLSNSAKDVKTKQLILHSLIEQKDTIGEFRCIIDAIQQNILSDDISSLSLEKFLIISQKPAKKHVNKHDLLTYKYINIFILFPKITQFIIDYTPIEKIYNLTEKGLSIKENPNRNYFLYLDMYLQKFIKTLCNYCAKKIEYCKIQNIIAAMNHILKNFNNSDYNNIVFLIEKHSIDLLKDFQNFYSHLSFYKTHDHKKEAIEKIFLKYNTQLHDYDSFINDYHHKHLYLILSNEFYILTISFIKWLIICKKIHNSNTITDKPNDNSDTESHNDSTTYKPPASPEREFINNCIATISSYDGTTKIDTTTIPDFLKKGLMDISYSLCLPSNFGYNGTKNIDLAKTCANFIQSNRPFYGTYFMFLIVASNPRSSTEEILDIAYTFLDIAASPEQSPYALHSLFGFVQVIKYAINQNPKIDLNLLETLLIQAEKACLFVAETGAVEAYLLLSELILEKERHFTYSLEKVLDIYKEAIKYLKKIETHKEDLECQVKSKIKLLNLKIDAITELKSYEESKSKTTTKKQKSKDLVTDLPAKQAPVDIESSEKAEYIDVSYFAIWQKTFGTSHSAKHQKKSEEINFWQLFYKLNKDAFNPNYLIDNFNILQTLLKKPHLNIIKTQVTEKGINEYKWVLIRIMQCTVYFHFRQCQNIIQYQIHIDKGLKLFFNAKKPVTVEDCQHEACVITSELIELIDSSTKVDDKKRADTKHLTELLLDIDKTKIPKKLCPLVASACSSFAHIISIIDFQERKTGRDRNASVLFDKADCINPHRLDKKAQKSKQEQNENN